MVNWVWTPCEQWAKHGGLASHRSAEPGTAFPERDRMACSERPHEGVRYSCAFCPYSGKRKDKLTAHLKTKHSEGLDQLKHLASPRTQPESESLPTASTSDLLDFVKAEWSTLIGRDLSRLCSDWCC